MSLLGSPVFANPTTPLWGGAGSNLPTDPTFDSVTFAPVTTPVASSTLQSIILRAVGSAVGTIGPLGASAFYAAADLGNYPRVIYQNDSIDYQQTGSGTSIFLAQVNAGSNGWDLPNVSSVNSNSITFAPNTTEMELSNVIRINGAPTPLTVTEFTSSFTSAGIDALPGTVMASQTFTAPANGKLFAQAIGNFQSTITTGTSVGFTIDVNGSNISNSTVNASCGNLILEVITPTMAQFPVTGGSVYDVCAIAYSATSSGDWNGISGQLFLSFTTL